MPAQTEILNLLATQGVFALLFGALLFYVLNESKKREGESKEREANLLKENSAREAKYQEIITALTEKFNLVERVQEDVKEIKTKIFN